MIDIDALRFDTAGLVTGVVQDADTHRVLMVGHLDRHTLQATLTTGQVHFWSRSRGELWRKGATSGNTLALVDIAGDCDGDAILISARPAGPTCHTGQTSCFGPGTPLQGFAGLERLWSTITDRAASRPPGSYTAELLAGGVDAVGRKVLEEAGEVLMAAKDHAVSAAGDDRLGEEVADLLFHLLVLLAERGVEPSVALDELVARAK